MFNNPVRLLKTNSQFAPEKWWERERILFAAPFGAKGFFSKANPLILTFQKPGHILDRVDFCCTEAPRMLYTPVN